LVRSSSSNPESAGSNPALLSFSFFPPTYNDEMPQRPDFQVKQALSLSPNVLIASKVIFVL
jgi:hypothetical protein